MYDDGALSGTTTRRDRRRDRGAGRHVRDRLEQHLAQPDRVTTQTRGGGRLAGNGFVGARHGVMIARTFPAAQLN